MYSQRPFEWQDTPTKAENYLATKKTYTFPVTQGGGGGGVKYIPEKKSGFFKRLKKMVNNSEINRNRFL